MAELILYQLDFRDGHWHLQFDFVHTARLRLMAHRLGRTVLLANRMDWSAEHVAGYSGQQLVEQVFRGLKDGEWLGWGPMHHWTDSRILVHAFHCMLGISMLQLLEELRQIQEFVLLYPPQGDKGPN